MKTKEWLKEKRTEKGLTQQELAEKLGFSVFTIENIEQGKRLGSAETWTKIENFFDDDEPKISFESNDLIEEIKKDIEEFGEDETCLLIYKIINNNIIFVNYDFDVEEDFFDDGIKPFDPKKELKKDEKYLKTTLQYALEVFEAQNKIM